MKTAKKRNLLNSISDYFELRDMEIKLKRCMEIPDTFIGSTILLCNQADVFGDTEDRGAMSELFRDSFEEQYAVISFLSEKLANFEKHRELSPYFQKWVLRLHEYVVEMQKGKAQAERLLKAIEENNQELMMDIRNQYKDRDALSALEERLINNRKDTYENQ